jgi:2,5-diamino-6-(ribosylamino)-4(3H)-pyrimidinone 5'-phosphate reductase
MAESPSVPASHDGPSDYNVEQHDDQSELADDTVNDMDTGISEDGGHRANQSSSYAVPEQPTTYSLFSNPPSLGLMRQRLFDVEDKIELSPSDFEEYFPYVDNVWRKCRTGEPQKDKNTLTEWYWCRLRKSSNYKPHVPKPTPEGKKGRKKRVREELTCGMSMKVIHQDGVVKSCTIIRGVSAGMKHTHNLDYMDQLKRNAGIMEVARKEAVRGFLPASIYSKMCEEQDNMNEAGGKFMKVSDVRNVQYQWRQDNPNVVLKAHTGYTPSRGGPRQKVAASPRPVPQNIVQESAIKPQTLPVGTLQYPQESRGFLETYLPDPTLSSTRTTPHITLTYASSLDSRIALMPGVQTAISGPETKAMTHYLRCRHDAILIGVRTAIADDPSLNCRLAGAGGYGGIGWSHQPRPIIIDPHARLQIRPEMKMLKIVSEGRARAPWIVVAPGAMLHPAGVSILKAHGGEYLMINDFQQGLSLNWEGLFQILFKEGIKSIMIEGGGIVLSELLKLQYAHLIDSVIVTIAPTYLGKTGVLVSPDPTYDEQGQPLASRLKQVRWQPMGEEDVVLCGKVKVERPQSHGNGILQGIEEFSRATAEPQTNPVVNGQTTTEEIPTTGPPHPVTFQAEGS